MSDNRGPGIVTIALGVCFGLILASEEGIGRRANVNLADKTPAASAQQPAATVLKAPALPSPSGMK